jgi:hypothetical protein
VVYSPTLLVAQTTFTTSHIPLWEPPNQCHQLLTQDSDNHISYRDGYLEMNHARCCFTLWFKHILMHFRPIVMKLSIAETCSQINSMEKRLTWEAHDHSAGQNIPYLLQNPKVHYHIYKSSSLDPILSQLDPVHTLTPISFNIHFKIILAFMLGPSK